MRYKCWDHHRVLMLRISCQLLREIQVVDNSLSFIHRMDPLELYKKIYDKQKIRESKGNILQREVIIKWISDKLGTYYLINKLDVSNQKNIFFSTITIFDNYINRSNDTINHLLAVTCLFLSLKMETMEATFHIDFFVHSIVGFMKNLSFRDIISEIIKTEKKILFTLKFEIHNVAEVNNFINLLFELNDEKNEKLKKTTWYIIELSLYTLPKIKPSLLAISAYILSQLKLGIEYNSKIMEKSLHNFSDVRKSVVLLNKMVLMDNKVYKDYSEIPIKKIF